MRTSPADHPGSAGSESGGSGVESIGGTSGRSSTYGDQMNQSPPRNELKLKPMPVKEVAEEPEDSIETENTNKLHVLRYFLHYKKRVANIFQIPCILFALPQNQSPFKNGGKH